MQERSKHVVIESNCGLDITLRKTFIMVRK